MGAEGKGERLESRYPTTIVVVVVVVVVTTEFSYPRTVEEDTYGK